MEFEYTASIFIEPYDLRIMYLRVKKGEDFDKVFMDIMCGYDDVDYYNCEYIIEDVRKEIQRRLKQSKD